jgi:hypothetical protein
MARVKIGEHLKWISQLPPPSSEQLARDMELSESRDYTVRADLKGKGYLTAMLPDLSRVPPGTLYVEAGVATVEGFGTAKISFDTSFSDTPNVIAVPFGFIELTVPWVTVEWRSFSIGWWTVQLPVPVVRNMTIRLPTMCFMMNVDKSGFEVFNVAGRTTISYIAVGR